MKNKYHTKRNDIKLEGKRLYLRPVKISDVTKVYVSWLNSKKINQYLESRFSKHTLRSVTNYVQKILKDHNVYFFSIILKESSRHVGNIKLGPIDWNHKLGDIGIMIGDKNSWGKGYATEAINLLVDFAFDQLNLHKLTAGSYKNNIGSIKAFQKADFIKESYRKKHFFYNGKYIDLVMLAKFKTR